jgi:hypothetical protein
MTERKAKAKASPSPAAQSCWSANENARRLGAGGHAFFFAIYIVSDLEG